MPIDPNIILGIKPVQLQQQDPMDQYGKSVALKNLMLQSDAAQRGIEDENAQRDALIASGGDNKRYRELLANRGQYKAVQGLDKFNLEAEDKRATIDKNKQEILIKATAAHRDQLANINDPKSAAQWVMAGYQDPVIGPVLSKALSIEQAIARIPQDPQEFQQWKNQAALGATRYIEANKPHITTQDVGGSSNIVSTPGLGGVPSVLSTTAKTQTPESIASNATAQRGQNMTDARARETADRDKLQIVTDTDGNITVVNKNTRVGAPAVDAQGNPLKGRQNLTESQGKAAGMALRAKEANDILNGLEKEGVMNRGIIKQGVGTVPLVGGALEMGANMLPGVLGGPSGKQQQVEQARRNFVNAVLRVESGASISEGEFKNAEKQYFPMPGDSIEVIAQKAANRLTAIAALQMQGGPAKATPAAKPASVDPTNLSDAELTRELGL